MKRCGTFVVVVVVGGGVAAAAAAVVVIVSQSTNSQSVAQVSWVPLRPHCSVLALWMQS